MTRQRAAIIGGTGYYATPEKDMKTAMAVMYQKMFTDLCIERFKWSNLPPSIDPGFLEKTLFYNGLAVYFEDEHLGPLALRGSPAGQVNMQDNPMQYMVYGNEFIQKVLSAVPAIHRVEMNDGSIHFERKPEECVPIWAKTSRWTDHDIVRIFSQRLVEADTTIDVTLENLRQPVILAIDADSVLSGQNFMKQIKEGARHIEYHKGHAGEMPVALDMGVKTEVPEKVTIARNQIMNQALSMLGIDNANQDKKERLVSDEVDANNAFVATMRAVNLNARRKAAHQINKRFDLDIRVDYHDGIGTTDSNNDPAVDAAELEGVTAGEFVHDDDTRRD